MASIVFDHVFGDEEHLKPWMNPSAVKIFPNAPERQNFTEFQKEQRTYYYVFAFGIIMLVSSGVLHVIVSVANSYREVEHDDDEDEEREQQEERVQKVKKETVAIDASKMLEIKGSFMVSDIWFTWFFMCYQFVCAAMIGWAMFHDSLDINSGMDYELYLAWVGEAIVTHFCCVIATVWLAPPDISLNSPIMDALFSIAPFLSDRFNGVQSWLTIGIYVATGSYVAYFCAGIVFVSLVISTLMLFSNPRYVASMKLSFWCCATQALDVDEGEKQFSETAQKHYDDLNKLLTASPVVREHGWHGRFADFQLMMLKLIDEETQQHKVITTVWSEIPCAIATVFFTVFQEFSLFIVISACVYVIKVFLLLIVRPYVVCMLADAEVEWHMCQAQILTKVMEKRGSYAWYCPWQKRVINALKIVKTLTEEPEECAACVRGIGNLLAEVDDDESAPMVVSFVNMLKEVHAELPEHHHEAQQHEGVYVFRKAISHTMKLLCPGIVKQDIIRPPILNGGNLGYLPSGVGLKLAGDIINLMREDPNGAADMKQILKGFKARYAKLPGHCNKRDDLVVFFSDLEPDDCMAIAQLWQWKIEMLRIGDEPIVIHGSDFSDKEKGTVFEKKRLVAQLMLGIREQYVLTPDPASWKSEKASDHPLASFWEGKRDTQLDAICNRIKEFQGKTIHFYIMAPGKGNIASILAKLKQINAFPSEKVWKMVIYSGSFNMRSMTPDDLAAINEIVLSSDEPLLDAAKHPFFGGKKYHKWTSSFTTFAPETFPAELNLSAHTVLTAGLKVLNDEHNLGLVHPAKLYKSKPLHHREAVRFEKIKHLHSMETVNEYCKKIQDDFALFSKVEDFKKSIISAFAFYSCDSPLADQLMFLLEFMRERMPDELEQMSPGGWSFDKEGGYTSVNADLIDSTVCQAIQPILSHPFNEGILMILRNKLREYLVRHLQMLQEEEEEEEEVVMNQEEEDGGVGLPSTTMSALELGLPSPLGSKRNVRMSVY